MMEKYDIYIWVFFRTVPVRFFLGPLSLVDHHSGQRKVLGGNNEVEKKTRIAFFNCFGQLIGPAY